MGPLLESRFQLFKSKESTELQVSLKEMQHLVETQPVNEWERKLAGVITSGWVPYNFSWKNLSGLVSVVAMYRNAFSRYSHKALRTLEEMVIDNPKDILSLRLAFMFALRLGDWSGLQTLMPKVVDAWTPDMPFYG